MWDFSFMEALGFTNWVLFMKKMCKDLLTPVGLLQKLLSKKHNKMNYKNLELPGSLLLLCREFRYLATSPSLIWIPLMYSKGRSANASSSKLQIHLGKVDIFLRSSLPIYRVWFFFSNVSFETATLKLRHLKVKLHTDT